MQHPENVDGVETQVPMDNAYMGCINSISTFTGLLKVVYIALFQLV